MSAIVVAGGIGFWMYRTSNRSFDADAWARREQAHDHVAEEIADGLLAKTTLRGMARAEVIRMLGMPTETSKFKEWDFVYWLGPERGFMSIDSEWLVIRLGPDGRVADYRIVRD